MSRTITLPESLVSHAYAATGVEDFESLESAAKGSGAKISKAEDAIAAARESLATLLPVALVYAFFCRTGGIQAKHAATVLGVKPDMVAIYAIGGALVAHGVDPFQARTDVTAAVRNGASKPALFDAALESAAAFRKVAKQAATEQAEKQAEKTETTGTTVTGDGDVDPTTETETETPEQAGHRLLLALAGSATGLIKALKSGDAVLSEQDQKSLAKVLVAVAKESGVIDVQKTPAPVAKSA